VLAVTGESTFDLPTAPAVAAGEVAPLESQAVAPAASLPEGWEAKVSGSTGDTYYLNLVR
jgi:hypothetical protein